MNTNNIFSSIRLRQIINDLKRRPLDASKDLSINPKIFNKYLQGKIRIDENFVKKAVKVWPVNISDFINPKYQKTTNYKVMRFKESYKTKRVMKRGGKDYYEYRDTVMDRDAPFRPEWIRELVYVKSNSPNEKDLKWNRGHLLHQLTYFVGEVNFYYIDKNNKKRAAVMNTGDSMYIAPYVPHTFASRNQKCEGYIVAITFSDKITNDVQNEILNFDKKKIKEIIFNRHFKNQNKVTVKKFKEKRSKSRSPFQIIELAKNKIIRTANFLQFNVKKNNNLNLLNSFHQYLYILSDNFKLKIEKKIIKCKKGDTVYLKPFTNYKFQKKNTKILVAQVQSMFSNEALEQLFHIGEKNFSRLIKDNTQWFKQ
ncbi:MAG: hypothetical protein CBE33_05130 [Candidatus Pelagibacter sp. TMED273]|nr:MAG: hypothetical protein CBE33_05130 [Candidatus Pelagibacter sp. TMED273]|tara:strand:- start:1975 stop:3078 length:1104 start_codon:yes stop_codon:yes gene_type:complete